MSVSILLCVTASVKSSSKPAWEAEEIPHRLLVDESEDWEITWKTCVCPKTAALQIIVFRRPQSEALPLRQSKQF